MIFITTGSQKFQFNRLLKEVDRLIETGVITEEVYAQIGYSDYKPEHYDYTQFMNRDTFTERINASCIVITHGGTGVIIDAVKKGKKVIAVPRLAKYGEHVDDHQLQLLKEFEESELICACYELSDLENYLKNITNMKIKEYPSNTKTIIADIENYLLSELTEKESE